MTVVWILLFHGTTNEWSVARIADWFGGKSYQVWAGCPMECYSEKKPFFSMVTTPYLHLFMSKDIAYIEELAFHSYDNKEKKR